MRIDTEISTLSRPTPLQVDLQAVRRAMSRNTILLVGSAVTYPHGVMDDIEELSEMAHKHGELSVLSVCVYVCTCVYAYVE